MDHNEKLFLSYKCPKTISDLQACSGGWYCNGCKKMVHDFRGLSAADVRAAFTKNGESLCAAYNAGQLRVAPAKRYQLRKLLSAVVVVAGLSSCYKEEFGVPFVKPNSLPSQTITEPHPVNNEIVFGMMAEINPEFPGGEAAFKRYVLKNIKWGGEGQGRVFVQFIIETDGSLTNVKILKGLKKSLDEQVLNAVQKSPKWKPGIRNGKPYKAQFTVPIHFAMEE